MRRLSLVAAVVFSVLLSGSALAQRAPEASTCQLGPGFAALRETLRASQGRDVTGACTGPEEHDAEGDGWQAAQHGLFVWRRSDNLTAFTGDGMTWRSTPDGLTSTHDELDPPVDLHDAVGFLPEVSYLMVLNARRASFDPSDGPLGAPTFMLSLGEVDQEVTVFSDRPYRQAFRVPLLNLVAMWRELGFVEDAPNAALVVPGAPEDADVLVVRLGPPSYDPERAAVTFHVEALSQDHASSSGLAHHARRADAVLPANVGPVSLFVDNATVAPKPVATAHATPHPAAATPTSHPAAATPTPRPRAAAPTPAPGAPSPVPVTGCWHVFACGGGGGGGGFKPPPPPPICPPSCPTNPGDAYSQDKDLLVWVGQVAQQFLPLPVPDVDWGALCDKLVGQAESKMAEKYQPVRMHACTKEHVGGGYYLYGRTSPGARKYNTVTAYQPYESLTDCGSHRYGFTLTYLPPPGAHEVTEAGGVVAPGVAQAVDAYKSSLLIALNTYDRTAEIYVLSESPIPTFVRNNDFLHGGVGPVINQARISMVVAARGLVEDLQFKVVQEHVGVQSATSTFRMNKFGPVGNVLNPTCGPPTPLIFWHVVGAAGVTMD